MKVNGAEYPDATDPRLLLSEAQWTSLLLAAAAVILSPR